MRYPQIKRFRAANGKWQVVKINNKYTSPKILFEHIDKDKAKRFEELYRQGRIHV